MTRLNLSLTDLTPAACIALLTVSMSVFSADVRGRDFALRSTSRKNPMAKRLS